MYSWNVNSIFVRAMHSVAMFRYSGLELDEFGEICLFKVLCYYECCLSVLNLTKVFLYCTSMYILEMLEISPSNGTSMALVLVLDRLKAKQSILTQC